MKGRGRDGVGMQWEGGYWEGGMMAGEVVRVCHRGRMDGCMGFGDVSSIDWYAARV